MQSSLKSAVVLILCVLALFDAYTTVMGLYAILRPTGDNPIAYALVFLPALAVLAFLLITEKIWHDESVIKSPLRFLWIIAALFDVYTSLRANIIIVFVGFPNLTEKIDIFQRFDLDSLTQLIIIGVLTLMISASPILLPYSVRD